MRLTALLLGLAALSAALPATALADDGERQRSPLSVERRSEGRAPSGTSDVEKPLHGGFSGRYDSRGRASGIVFGHRGRDTHISVRFNYPVARPAACRFVPGYHTYETRYVVVPGYYTERVIPARYGDRWDPYRRCYVRVRLAPRRVVREWVPERKEARQVKIWVPGKWVCHTGCERDHAHHHDDHRYDDRDRHDRHDRRDRYDRDDRRDRHDRDDRGNGRGHRYDR